MRGQFPQRFADLDPTGGEILDLGLVGVTGADRLRENGRVRGGSRDVPARDQFGEAAGA